MNARIAGGALLMIAGIASGIDGWSGITVGMAATGLLLIVVEIVYDRML